MVKLNRIACLKKAVLLLEYFYTCLASVIRLHCVEKAFQQIQDYLPPTQLIIHKCLQPFLFNAGLEAVL